MQHISANSDGEAFEPALVAADGEGIEQGLGGVFMLAVAGIDDGAS